MNILVYTKANGFVHESRIPGAAALKLLGQEHNFQTTITSDSTMFAPDILSRFDVVVFISTSGTVLGDEGKKAFQNFIRNGGGFVGIHGASTTEYEWDWYGRLVGAYFDGHPRIQIATIHTTDQTHPSTKHFSARWQWEDEWYNWQASLSENVNVLLTVDENTYEGGNHSDYHPIAWSQEFDGGRSWYTSLGHKAEYYTHPAFLEHLAGGIYWAAGVSN
ncbi:MAG: ThuA domain-containing protein [Balneolales bacterium]